MIKLQKKIYELLTEENYSFGDDFIEFLFNEEIIPVFNELGLEPDIFKQRGSQYIRIQKRDLPFYIYENKYEFQKIYEVNKINKNKKDILIISADEQQVISFINEETYINFEKKDNYFYFTNIFCYVDFIAFLKSLDSEDENAFHFIDYFNKDYKKIVLTSLSDKSRIIIKYNDEIPIFNEKKDFSKKFIEFTQCFNKTNNQIIKFIKSAFIEYASRYDFDNRLPDIFINLDKILETARLNFEIYVNNLSIDKIKEDYYNYKTKYFKNISDILSKLTQKIIGLPIAFATTLFIVNKLTQKNISDNSLFLYVLISILSITTIFIVFLLKIHYRDLLSINSSFSRDFNNLINNNFFNKYPEEKNDFEEIEDNVNTKIRILKYVTIGYYLLLTSSNLLLFYFIIDKLGVNITKWNLTVQISVFILIILLLLFGYIFITKKKKSVA